MATAAKRFWTEVDVAIDGDGFIIRLDGRDIKTPNGSIFRAPNQALANAVRDEWDAQVDFINPDEMPMFKFLTTAIDRITPQRDAVVAELVNYGANDLLCYRAETENKLAKHQHDTWQAYLDWADAELGIRLEYVQGMMPKNQSDAAKAAMHGHVDGFSDLALSGLHYLTTISGSLVLGLAAERGFMPMEKIIAAAQLDELWQLDKWGYDADADKGLKQQQRAMMTAHRYLEMLNT
ncbi:MAG: ATP12 family chaperone protein [Candidatus Puniceispirillales bacterium WSBS_2018_MAG_OTU23]